MVSSAAFCALAMMIGGIAWIYAVKRRHGNLGRDGAPAVAAALKT